MIKNVILTIEQLTDKAIGIARYKNQQIKVPYSLVDELVEVELDSSLANARLVSVIKANPKRVSPPCNYFENCGGCALQHLNNKDYNDYKQTIIEKLVLNLKQIKAQIKPLLFIGFNKRRRTTFKVQQQKIGYFKAYSHQIVNITNCLLLQEELNNLIIPLNKLLLQLTNLKVNELILSDYEDKIELIISAKFLPNIEQQEIISKMAVDWQIARVSIKILDNYFPIIQTQTILLKKSRIEISEESFIQATHQAQQEIEKFILTKLINCRKIVDLFAGLGGYSLILSQSNKIVHAVEINSKMVENLKSARINNITVEQRNIHNNPLGILELNYYQAAIINPPRSGAKHQLINLAKSKINHIIMIYCDIDSFRRDATVLISANYQLMEIQGIDQFAYSHHLEVIAHFEKI